MIDNRVIEVPINLIKTLDNSRVRIGNQDLISLMEDIKHRGLLQPIGVLSNNNTYIIRFGNRRLEACKKLGWKSIPAIVEEKELDIDSFMADNVAENIHRKDLTPIELSKVVLQLKERNLSISEISIALSLPKNRIVESLRIASYAPEKFKNEIETIRNASDKKGKISMSVANEILNNRRTRKEVIDELFELAKTEELSAQDIRVINNLLWEGKDIKEAKEKYKDYRPVSVDLIFVKKEFEEYKLPIKDLIKSFIKGTIKPNKKLLP